MSDSSIVDPAGSSYNLPKPTEVPVGDVPQMEMDRVLPRQQSTGLARGVQQLGSPNLAVDSGENQIIVADTVGQVNTNRVLMGNQSVYGEGFYVTKPGIDVKTAKSDADFIFNSNQNVFKIVETGTTNVTTPAAISSANFTINHNLGFVPITIAYINNAYQFIPLPVTFWGTTASKGSAEFEMHIQGVTDTQIIFQITNWASLFNGQVFPLKYYFLQETAD